VPAAPSGITAAIAAASKIKVTFTDNAANETGFKLERSADAGATWKTILLPAQAGTGGTGTRIDAGLLRAHAYKHRVKAYNLVGDSPYAGPVDGTTPP
jgi:hypothetical protein